MNDLQRRLLGELRANGPQDKQQLADALNVKAQLVRSSVWRLHQLGLVRLHSNTWLLTERGEALAP